MNSNDQFHRPVNPRRPIGKKNKQADIVQTTPTSTLCAGNGRVTLQLDEIVEIDFKKKSASSVRIV